MSKSDADKSVVVLSSPYQSPISLVESESSTASSQEQEEHDNCPICLEEVSDQAVLDKCFHRFCFECIKTWVELTPTCPLCKSTFQHIIHNIQSPTIFDLYQLPEKARTTSTHRHAPRFVFGQVHQSRIAASVARRRRVYVVGARALPEQDPDLRRRLRSLAPSRIRQEHNMRRLRPWIYREFCAIVGQDNADFVSLYFVSLLETVSTRQRSRLFTLLHPYLFGKTDHFLHEFLLFARSPLDIFAYDRHVQYDRRLGDPFDPPPNEPSPEEVRQARELRRSQMIKPLKYGDGSQKGALGHFAHSRPQSSIQNESSTSSCSSSSSSSSSSSHETISLSSSNVNDCNSESCSEFELARHIIRTFHHTDPSSLPKRKPEPLLRQLDKRQKKLLRQKLQREERQSSKTV